MSNEPRQPQDKYVLRLPDGMRDRIKAAAAANNRSMNAEIVATLEEKYPRIEDQLAKLWERFDELTDDLDHSTIKQLHDLVTEIQALSPVRNKRWPDS